MIIVRPENKTKPVELGYRISYLQHYCRWAMGVVRSRKWACSRRVLPIPLLLEGDELEDKLSLEGSGRVIGDLLYDTAAWKIWTRYAKMSFSRGRERIELKIQGKSLGDLRELDQSFREAEKLMALEEIFITEELSEVFWARVQRMAEVRIPRPNITLSMDVGEVTSTFDGDVEPLVVLVRVWMDAGVVILSKDTRESPNRLYLYASLADAKERIQGMLLKELSVAKGMDWFILEPGHPMSMVDEYVDKKLAVKTEADLFNEVWESFDGETGYFPPQMVEMLAV